MRIGLLLCSGLLASCRTPLADWYADQQFAARFDRVHASIPFGTAALFVPHTHSLDADELLDELRAVSPAGLQRHGSSRPRIVLFVRSGTTCGRSWLAFACASKIGLEVFSFIRGDRSGTGYDRPFETRQFWGLGTHRTGTLELAVDKVWLAGDTVTTIVRFNGVPNTVDWSVTAAPDISRRSNMAYASQAILVAATPKTGWTDGDGWWWPETTELKMLDGPPATAEIPSISGALKVSFVPDGRIAVVSSSDLAILSPAHDSVQTRSLADLGRRTESALFSPDGLSCYVRQSSYRAFLLPTLGGPPVSLGRLPGMPLPFFLDNRTLIAQCQGTDWWEPDIVSGAVAGGPHLRRFDSVTGAVTATPKPAEDVFRFVQSGGTLAYTTHGQWERTVRVQDGARSFDVPNIQGLHQISLSPDRRWLALKGQSGISFFDVQTGRIEWEHDLHHDFHTAYSEIKWSQDGLMGATAGMRFTYVWSLGTPKWIARFPHGRRGGVRRDVALSPDGKAMAATGEENSTVAYWEDIHGAIRATGQDMQSGDLP